IPPSLRGQVKPSIAPQPGFAPPPAQPQKPPSAAEDLFGLDALSASPPTQQGQPGVQVQTQNTGGSVPGARGGGFDDPFSAKSASSPTAPSFGAGGSPRTATSHFKPFIPSSSFGQGLATQNTGGSAASSQQGPQSAGGFGASTRQAPASAMDDLLGDNDESSRKLGNDTSELANMSNQIGILRNQMADVTSKKQATEQDLAQTSSQKRDLEMRLSQFRTQYEAEARAVKELEEQLSAARKDTRRIQQDLAVLEAGWQDLQAQHGNAARALEQERNQNAQLKQRMQAINAEVAQLKPQLEQMQREAKIERGRVSINRKEVERSEATRDGVKAEMDQLRSEAAEARSAPPAREEVASPALSTTSASGGKGNPFFRKSPQPSFDAGSNMSPSAFGAPPQQQSRGVTSPQQQGTQSPNITNIFGPSFGGTPVTSPPATSFGRSEPFPPQEPSVTSSEGPGLPTPSASPHPSEALPPPPASRQITSSDLPMGGSGLGMARPDTAASSVRVETPTSRITGMETPTAPGSASPAPVNERPVQSRQESTGAGLFDRAASPVASVASNASRGGKANQQDFFSSFGGGSQGIPGAFPDPTPLEPEKTGGSTGAFSDRSK
ncbi:MAG: hypothetical protein INR71_12305, partial [Terriglobus roseus]|nr:hypothetical protein [Terriglobus roseus]